MGRKPNPVIHTHFRRGEKLNDSSNRYQYTCSHCGERFPKGRMDTLISHLTKKCNAISDSDRRKAVLDLSNLSDLPENTSSHNGTTIHLNGPTVELPISTPWTALQTLAEASKHMDAIEKQDDRSIHNRSVGHGSRASEPPHADRLELQEQWSLDNPPHSYDDKRGQGQREKKTPHQKPVRLESEASVQAGSYHMPGSRDTSPSLAETAAAAARFIPSIDPQLLGEEINTNARQTIAAKAIDQDLHERLAAHFFSAGGAGQPAAWSMLDAPPRSQLYPEIPQNDGGFEAAASSSFQPIAMNNASMTTEFTSESGNGDKTAKPKVRGKFAAERRKQVQQVRVLGSCLRCRMLKKPCSEGTPCNTCKSVDTARLWKADCIRAKLPDIISMFSAGLHAVLAHHNANAAKNQASFQKSQFAIEASHFPESNVFITISALEGHDIANAGSIDPGLNAGFQDHSRRLLLNTDDDEKELVDKLTVYMKRVSIEFTNREPSHFMNSTLATARDMVSQSDQAQPDDLLSRAIELWVIVQILVDSNTAWIISERTDIEAPAGSGPVVDKENKSYQLMCGQLNAVAEKKAADLCKSVLGDLEKRLVQRGRNSPFELFLISIIVLNCVEKAAWLFKSWEQASFKGRWPLDKGPESFASQGDRLAGTLNMLLNVRSSPPKTFIKANGVLATDADQASEQYFDRLQLNYTDVFNRSSSLNFDPGNCRCYEMRFCSRLLLPPTV